MIVYLAVITTTDAQGAPVALYLSDGRVGDPLQTMAVDDPDQPRQVYRPILTDVNVDLSLERGARGEVVAANAQGTLDYVRNWRWGSAARIEIRRGAPGQYWAAMTPVVTGPVMPPESEVSTSRVPTISWRVRDRLEELEVDLQSNTYAGTNVGPTGDEGTADDLQGKPKPIILGQVLNVPAPACNAPGQRRQLHDGAIHALDVARDEELELTIVAAPPSASQVSVDLATAIVTHGSPVVGTATYDVRGDAAGGYVDLPGQLIRRVVARAGWGTADLDLSALSALDVACPWAMGYRYDARVSVRQVVRDILESCHGWHRLDAANRLTVGLHAAPAGAPVARWRAHRIARFESSGGGAGRDGRPVGRVEVRFGRNHTVRRGVIDQDVVAERKAWVGEEWRTATWEDAQILADWPDARTLVVETGIISESGAQALAAHVGTIYADPRNRWRVAVRLVDADGVRPGDVVEITYPADGYDAGALARVDAITLGDPHREMATATVWR